MFGAFFNATTDSHSQPASLYAEQNHTHISAVHFSTRFRGFCLLQIINAVAFAALRIND